MKELLIGIDDAGRGPIIGPMVLAGVLIEKKDEPLLKEWGAKDSKQLSAEKREEIAGKIKEKFKFHFELATPEEIDSRTKMGTNLNRIEAVKSAKIINELMKDMNEKVNVIIDCPSTNIEAWRSYVLQHIDKKELVILSCEHKADANHISVSAASIIAKTTRDREIELIKQKIGIDCGSGYPSDPVTCKFIEEHFDKLKEMKIVRESWGTYDNLKAKKEQKKLF